MTNGTSGRGTVICDDPGDDLSEGTQDHVNARTPIAGADAGDVAAVPGPQRSSGRVDLRVGRGAAHSVVTDLHQGGALRLRLPRPSAGIDPEAVLINTAGGMTGGDRYRFTADLGAGAAACVTGQACEKLYRSAGGEAHFDVRLSVGARAEFSWLPQPAILFDASAFTRRLEIDLAEDASLVAVEASILGRSAMGERVRHCRLREHWRLRRSGRLIWAGETRLDSPAQDGGYPSTLGGGRAMATLVMAGPEAAGRLDDLRAVLARCSGRGGASAFDGMLLASLVAPDADALMEDLRRLVECARQRPIPRVWTC